MIVAADLSLVVLFIGYFVTYFNDIVGIIGGGGILAAILLIAGTVAVGYLLGGSGMGSRKVFAPGTGQ